MSGDLFSAAIAPPAMPSPKAMIDEHPFVHPCCYPGCGRWGGLGYGVNLRAGERGRWACADLAHQAFARDGR